MLSKLALTYDRNICRANTDFALHVPLASRHFNLLKTEKDRKKEGLFQFVWPMNIRRHLFILLDYVTPTEFFQIGDHKKNEKRAFQKTLTRHGNSLVFISFSYS